MPQAFKKPATTYDQQVELLRQRGMIIADVEKAKFYLQHLNYYRLGAYWLPFEVDHTSHQFKSGTSFDDVLNLYVFDRELRLLVLDGIERIEVSVRAQWAYQLGHLHGPHAHLDEHLFSPQYWSKNLEKLTKEIARSNETFIKHLKENYTERLPPVWAAGEVMSFGSLSQWYGSLKPKQTRQKIADPYEVNEQVLESWLRHLLFVRNVCAHHLRLWNRDFTILPKQSQSKPQKLVGEFVPKSRKIYNTLVILVYLMDLIAPSHNWRARLKKIILEYNVPLRAMGFPQNWEEQRIWEIAAV